MLTQNPKKYLGQHFLHDDIISQRIVAALNVQTALPYTLLEIGPGRGALTKFLVAKSLKNFYLIEVDTTLVSYLAKTYPTLKNYLIAADFLTVDLAKKFSTPISVIGNFPYNISSQIFFKLLTYRSQVQEIVCMVQKEVAERIIASPGSKIYGIPSIFLQAFYDIEYLFTVAPSAFIPQPSVQSAVIRLRRNTTSHLPCHEAFFFQLVKNSFQQRRKKLSNIFRHLGLDLTNIQSTILDKRPERLTIADFIALTQVLAPPTHSADNLKE